MADPALDEKAIRDEAAGWYARLNNQVISNQLLRDFRAWRLADPRHDAAYIEIEQFWRRAGRLETDPDIERAAQEALQRKDAKGAGRRRPGSSGVLAALLAAVLVGGGALAWRAWAPATFSTDVGEQRAFRLADGSRVRLDSDSRIRVRLSDHQRRIELVRGQAFFDVAHDASRPFIVRAGATQVEALGTRFDVRHGPGGVGVTLVEGRVRVAAPQAGHPRTWTLVPGQQLVVTSGAVPARVQAVDTSEATSWTQERLVFHATPLATAIAEVNRYGRRKVVLDDPALGETPVSGVFETGDTPAFVAAVADLYHLQVETRPDDVVLRRAP